MMTFSALVLFDDGYDLVEGNVRVGEATGAVSRHGLSVGVVPPLGIETVIDAAFSYEPSEHPTKS